MLKDAIEALQNIPQVMNLVGHGAAEHKRAGDNFDEDHCVRATAF